MVSWGVSEVCLGWGKSIGVSVWVFIAMELGFFKFGSMFGLGWEYWCERLSIYYDGVGGFQGIGRLGNEEQAIDNLS